MRSSQHLTATSVARTSAGVAPPSWDEPKLGALEPAPDFYPTVTLPRPVWLGQLGWARAGMPGLSPGKHEGSALVADDAMLPGEVP